MYRFNINTAGFVIVGLFIATWLAALLIWRFARIEERWNTARRPARREFLGLWGCLPEAGHRSRQLSA
jgi:hypothetical protein